jgi:hypothetical protein
MTHLERGLPNFFAFSNSVYVDGKKLNDAGIGKPSAAAKP